jgi:ketosteroid isomerase-like protein
MEEYVVGKNKRDIKLIRYADDIVVFSKHYDLVIEAEQLLSKFLSKMKLKLSPSKTYIGHTQYSHKDKTSIIGLNYLGY